MKTFNISEYGIEFKNLVSGPAPVGRILNYINICGNSQLKHKNGYRSTNLANGIGCAWTTELMIGLGIFTLGYELADTFILNLTDEGNVIYNLIKDTKICFTEGSTEQSLKVLRREVNQINNLYESYKSLFIKSIPFQILREFLLENGFYYLNRTKFIDDYFETIKNIYDTDSTPYNRNARTTTGQNRVPSLLQLCQFFNLLDDNNGALSFNMSEISKPSSTETITYYSAEEMSIKVKEDEVKYGKITNDDLAEKYGIDGTVLISAIVRNSTVQQMFKNNLMLSQGGKCVLCGLKHKSLLIGSHIKPAVESNVFEKIDENNGLLLCCNHDKLFDQHLITFNFLDGQIEISKTLSPEDRKKLELDENFHLPPELLTDERSNYLMEHNLEFNNKESKR